MSTLVVTLFVCSIFCAIFMWRRKKLKQKINSNNKNFNELDSDKDRYDDVNHVYEENYYERINEYEKINYEERNVEENTYNKYTKITEYEIMNAIIK